MLEHIRSHDCAAATLQLGMPPARLFLAASTAKLLWQIARAMYTHLKTTPEYSAPSRGSTTGQCTTCPTTGRQ
ncbi:MAG: hypothetical protein EOO61_09950 [Hymenobacter sp.]|nr:MAG: hypothetical protein EOO61_09950 [Hymenobacter sp.]